MTGDLETVRAITLTMLGARAPGLTVCPSEVARALAAKQGFDSEEESWRDFMPTVHDAIDQLVADGIVRLSWKGKRLAVRKGPYRISRKTSV